MKVHVRLYSVNRQTKAKTRPELIRKRKHKDNNMIDFVPTFSLFILFPLKGLLYFEKISFFYTYIHNI